LGFDGSGGQPEYRGLLAVAGGPRSRERRTRKAGELIEAFETEIVSRDVADAEAALRARYAEKLKIRLRLGQAN